MRVRSVLLGVVAVAMGLVFVHQVGPHYAPETWLAWTLIELWGWQIFLATAFLSAGTLVAVRLLRLRPAGRLEQLSIAGATGAVVFAMGALAAGFLGFLRPWWAVAWPGLMLAGGLVWARPSLVALVTSRSQGAAADDEPARATRTTGGRIVVHAVLAFGTLILALVYLGLLSPDSLSYDAVWTHLAIAQDYAREGRIVPFPADWPKNLAHLGSVINTWAFLIPDLGPPPVRWMMALHTEFVFLLWTLVGVAAAVNWAAGRRVSVGWSVYMLFPGLLILDSNIGGGSDHFAAFFVPPALLAAIRVAGTGALGWWVLLGAFCGAGVITKYQSAYVLIPVAGWAASVHLVRWARGRAPRGALRVWRRHATSGGPAAALLGEASQVTGWLASVADDSLAARPVVAASPRPRWSGAVRRWAHRVRGGGPSGAERPTFAAPLLGLLVATAVAAPHFIRNWVFYGDPLYPFAQRLFPGCHPRMPDSAVEAETIISHWGTKPPSDLWQRLVETVRLTFNFSFHTHAGYTNDVPVYGSLFTLCLPLVLLVPKARRAWVAVGLGLAALFGWAWTYRVDRNLQVVTPLLAVATAALLARAWQVGRLARLGVATLVLAQLVWGGDHYFLGNDRVDSAIALIRSGFDGRAATRFDRYRADYLALGRSLPRDAKVLLHNDHGNLGIDRPVLLDWLGMQGLIDARTFRSPRDAWDRYRQVGITHIVYRPGLHPAPLKQEDVVFAAFLDRYASRARQFGGLHLLAMPDDPPPIEPAYRVLVVGIGGYADGVYDIAALGANEGLPLEMQQRGSPMRATNADEAPGQLGAVDAVLLAPSATTVRDAPELASAFHNPITYGDFSVWVRATPRPR